MADSSGIRAGRGFMELSVRGPWEKQIDAAAKKIKAVGEHITDIGKKTLAIGSAITAPLLIAAQRFASMGDQINKASQRTGVGIEALQELKYAAEQSGVEFSDLETGVRKMQKTLFSAAGGSAEARKALAGIGLTIADLKALKPDEQFQLIGDRINNIADPTARAAVAMEIFGKSGTGLLPLFTEGAAGMKALRDRAEALGIVFSSQDAKAATLFEDTLRDLWLQLNAIVFQVGAAIAQALQPFAVSAINCLKTVIEWTRENRSLAIGLLAAGAALIVLGTGIIGVGLAIKAVALSFTGITIGFKVLTALAGAFLNPVFLVTAAIAALGIYLLYTTQNGGKLLAWLGDRFNELADTAKKAFGGIADALKAGDIALAAKILWTGLQLAWAEGTQDLKVRWYDFRATMVTVAASAFATVYSLWINTQALLERAWIKLGDKFSSVLRETITAATGFWSLYNEAIYVAYQNAKVVKGDLTQKQADENKDYVHQMYAAEANARQAEQSRAERAAKAGADERLASVETERKQKLQDLDRLTTSIASGAADNSEEDKRALRARIDDLKKQLESQRKDAEDERDQRANAPFPSLVDPSKLNSLDDVINNRGNLDIKAAGLFNVSALQSLQGNPVQDAIRKATEATAKYTKKIAEGAGAGVAIT